MKRVMPAVWMVLGLTGMGAILGAIFGELSIGAVGGFMLALVLALPVVALGTDQRTTKQTLRSFFLVFRSGSGP